jgi:hypothetical protein
MNRETELRSTVPSIGGVGMDNVQASVKMVDDHVNDVQNEANSTTLFQNPPEAVSKIKLDYIVIAIVLIAAIVFGAFQITECVNAHSSPGSQTQALERARLSPGLMICPYALTNEMLGVMGGSEYCPKWKEDASLSFEWPSDCLYSYCVPQAFNTNFNFHETGRSQSVCSQNIQKPNLNLPDSTKNGASFQLYFGNIDHTTRKITSFAQERNIKNSPQSGSTSSTCNGGTECKECLTWTPPNVKCLVFDPFEFDKMALKYGMDPKCNPMNETVSSSFDSFRVVAHLPDLASAPPPGFPVIPGQGFQYKGLIPQSNTGSSSGNWQDQDPSRFISLHQMQVQLKSQSFTKYVSSTLFGGLMIVLYNPLEGIPQKFDFNAAPRIMSNQEGLFATSNILLSQKTVQDPTKSNPPVFEYKFTKPTGATVISVVTSIQKTFTNAVLNKMRETVKYMLTSSSSVYQMNEARKADDDYDFSLQFPSSTSLLTEQFVKISILTTISIILSTTATLWGAREKLAEGILLVSSKARIALQEKGISFDKVWPFCKRAEKVVIRKHILFFLIAKITCFAGTNVRNLQLAPWALH